MPCSSCGAAIAFITSAPTGKPIPVNVLPLKVVTRDGRVIDGFVSHFATCASRREAMKPKVGDLRHPKDMLLADKLTHYWDHDERAWPAIRCPFCHSENVHVSGASMDAGGLGFNYGAAVVDMSCEDGCEFELIVGAHKGCAYVTFSLTAMQNDTTDG